MPTKKETKVVRKKKQDAIVQEEKQSPVVNTKAEQEQNTVSEQLPKEEDVMTPVEESASTEKDYVSVTRTSPVDTENEPVKRGIHPLFMFAVVGLLVGGTIWLGILYYRSHTQKNSSAALEKQSKELVNKVTALADVPQNENPTIAVVSDVNKLPKAPLFLDAQNGDQVLVYTRAKKAYVYRPKTNKIIAIGPITITADTQSQSVQPSVSLTPTSYTVVIYNGTNTSGLAKEGKTFLADKQPTASVSALSDAKQKEYAKTVIVDISGNHATDAKQLATSLNASIGTLPSGENKPQADILVILGKDFVGK